MTPPSLSSSAASAAPLPTDPEALAPAVHAAYARALGALERAQKPNGAWAGEAVWNPMLPCQYVIVMHVLGREIPADRKTRIRRQLERTRKRDGGWGMHPDAPPADELGAQPQPGHPRDPDAPAPPDQLAGKYDSWMFHTVLGYVALRLLGDEWGAADDPLLVDAREWILAHGGPERSPTWGRAWLALLGLYPWDMIQPLLPELWLLPDEAPMHPRRLYCHMRLIYLGLSYLWGARVQGPATARVEAIRAELYPGGATPERFLAARDDIAPTDLFEPVGTALQWIFAGARVLDRAVPKALRQRALDRAFEHIEFEFRSTDWVCLSPVNGMLFCLALAHRDPNHPDLDRALAGLEYWVWEDEDEGLRICGARSDIWDTSFILQALAEGPPLEAAARMAERASRWLPTAQLDADIPGGADHYRSPARGGWGFADERHPWPVSDCTAEALEALLHLEGRGWGSPLPPERKLAAVEFILLRQNDDGGFGSYEERRGSMALIHFNPAEMYGNCMLEYSYGECTASCVRALAVFRAHLEAGSSPSSPDLAQRLTAAIDAGVVFLLQAVDERTGAWRGFWGINLTYGTYFAVSALLAAGVDRQHLAIRRAVRHLLSRQRDDGGWGEHYSGLLDGREHGLPPGQTSRVTQTAWAMATLELAAPQPGRAAIDRAVAFLLERQRDDGTWEHDGSVGVFFNTAVLDYRLYRQVFPTWALARWLARRQPDAQSDAPVSS